MGSAHLTALTSAGDHDQVVIAALAVVGTLAGAIVLLVKIYNESKGANSAVNDTQKGEARIYDRVAQTQDMVSAQMGYMNAKLIELNQEISHLRSELQDHVEWGLAQQSHNSSAVANLHEFLREHDRWERSEKYRAE